MHFEVNEVSSWQVTENSKVEELAKDRRVQTVPFRGPVYVEGAEPGDALVVNIESVKPASWGWTAVMPGLGLLEEFTTPELFIWKLRAGASYCTFVKKLRIPLNPFCGVLGVAPPEDGYFDVLPPGKHGGNMDIRHLIEGSRVLLPVWNEGSALFRVRPPRRAGGWGSVRHGDRVPGRGDALL